MELSAFTWGCKLVAPSQSTFGHLDLDLQAFAILSHEDLWVWGNLICPSLSWLKYLYPVESHRHSLGGSSSK